MRERITIIDNATNKEIGIFPSIPAARGFLKGRVGYTLQIDHVSQSLTWLEVGCATILFLLLLII